MVTVGEMYALGGKDKEAAAREREERLNSARNKLKTYRARHSKLASNDSPASTSISTATTSMKPKRASLLVETLPNATGSSSAGHRKSLSKSGNVITSHSRKASKSKGSTGGHAHHRSRASTSFANAQQSLAQPLLTPTATTAKFLNDRIHGEDLPIPFMDFSSGIGKHQDFNALAGWQIGGLSSPATPSSSEVDKKNRRTSLIYGSASNFFNTGVQQLLASVTAPTPSPLAASLPISIEIGTPTRSASTGPTHSHARRPSRHNRQSSVSNFRESIEIMSGTGMFMGGLSPGVSSFAATGSSPPLSASPRIGSPLSTWANDPVKVLEILKERGRLENLSESDPIRTRQSALEALEGRLSAPSEMINLGNFTNGELLVAPRSPGYTISAPPFPLTSPTPPFAAPPVGLGLSSNSKRNSWGTLGPVTAAGAKGAMDLGMLIEEEEEEEVDDDDDILPASSPSTMKSKRTPSKGRPLPLTFIPTPPAATVVEDTPAQASFAVRPMRLSTSSIASLGDDSPATPADSPSQRPALRLLTLRNSSSTKRHSNDILLSSSMDSVRNSQVLGAAPPALAPRPNMLNRSASQSSNRFSTQSQPGERPTPPMANRGLRSLSTGIIHNSLDGPPVAASPLNRSPISNRRSFGVLPPTTSAPSAAPSISPRDSKRNPIAYLANNTPLPPSLASSEGPLSPRAQAARRPWRTSIERPPSTSPAEPIPSSTMGGYAFPFAASHGNFGGFGDLEVEEDGPITTPARRVLSPALPRIISTDPVVMALQGEIDMLRNRIVQDASVHHHEVLAVEKRAGEDARGLRLRIIELERQLEEGRVGRRFEVEGLSREVEQATEAMSDLREERDSLVEDVDGWRNRCATLETAAKKERDDDPLTKAQAKLSGEMRDQIYNLVEALERERNLHDQTRQELERNIIETGASPPIEDGEEAAFGSRGHVVKNRSRTSSNLSPSSSFGQSRSGSITEETSVATDFDDSPPHFAPTYMAGLGLKGRDRDSDIFSSAALGGLDTLAEEDEEDDDTTGRIIEQRGQTIIDGVNERDSPPDEVELMEDQMTEAESDRIRLGSGSTDSTENSEAMPMTSVKEYFQQGQVHRRSDSFVRHWSFPKGAIAPIKISGEDHSFFDLGRHTSLPALPIAASLLPPFLCADLSLDDEHFSNSFDDDPRFFPSLNAASHLRRPSSPRAMSDPARLHSKRFSGQFKAPPVSPSARVRTALNSNTSVSSASSFSASVASPTASTFASLSRLSFGNLSNLLGYSTVDSPSITRPLPPRFGSTQLSASAPARVSTRPVTPLRYVRASDLPPPKRSPLSKLDFRLSCCEDEVSHDV